MIIFVKVQYATVRGAGGVCLVVRAKTELIPSPKDAKMEEPQEGLITGHF